MLPNEHLSPQNIPMSIRLRLTVVYAAILTGFFLCFGVFSYFVARSTLLTAVDSTLETTTFRVVDAAKVFNAGELTLLKFPDDMDTFQTSTVFMMAINRDGEVLANSPNLSNFAGVLDTTMLDSLEPSYSDVTHSGKRLRVYTYPLIIQQDNVQQLIGHLQVAQLLDNYYDALSRLGMALALTGGVVFIFFLFLGTMTTHSLLRPLGEITAVALQISRADDLGRRLPDSGRRDEIGYLTMALNQTFERLERVFRTQQRFLADVSHELRTPLTTVRGNVDLMRRMGEYDPELLDIVRDETDRMTRLVGDLLLLARADGGSIPMSREPLEVESILIDVYRQMQSLQEERQVGIEIKDITAVRAIGDADRIKQLLIILVDNAMKYTPTGGVVTLALTRDERQAYIAITDNGPGIPSQHIPFIFDRFYRVDKARSRAQGGSGLGLSIAKWIADVHGGRIVVTSTVGAGSTFTVVLPAMPEEGAADLLLEGDDEGGTGELSTLSSGVAG